MFAIRRALAAIAVTLVAVTACRSKPAPPPPPAAPPPAPVVARPEPPRVNQDSINRARAAEASRLAAAAAAAVARTRATLVQQIYFDFDKDDIRDDQRATLDAKVPILNANSNARIRVGGHTDDRGSDEYNLALGQRRAAAAKRYLVSRGIAESRIETVSFGEERPAANGETEEAWSRNRRDEFEVTSGGENLKAPQ